MILRQLKKYIDDLILENGDEHPCVSWTRLVEWTSISDHVLENCSDLEDDMANIIDYWEQDKREQLEEQEANLSKERDDGEVVDYREQFVLETPIESNKPSFPIVGAIEKSREFPVSDRWKGILRETICNDDGSESRVVQVVSTPHYDDKYKCIVMTFLVEGYTEYILQAENAEGKEIRYSFNGGPRYDLGYDFCFDGLLVGSVVEIRSFQPKVTGNRCVHLVVRTIS